MTASPEESADQARRTLRSTEKEQAYTAIDGRIASGSVETTTAHFAAPSTLSADHRAELVELARQALARERMTSTGPVAAGANAPSFLQALAAMLRRPEQNETTYVYAGRAYSLWTTRSPDATATAYFS